MLRKITINLLMLSLLILNSPQLFAQSHSEMLSKPELHEAATHHGHSSSLERIVRESRLYEYLLKHPSFIKVQDIAQRVWENQTRIKRRVAYTPRRNIFSHRLERK